MNWAENTVRTLLTRLVEKGALKTAENASGTRTFLPAVKREACVRAESESGEWQDWLVDETPSQEARLVEDEELSRRRSYLKSAMSVLNDRERRVFEARRLAEDPATLEDLSAEFGVSRERIRQIEVRAFEKVQKAVTTSAKREETPHMRLQ